MNKAHPANFSATFHPHRYDSEGRLTNVTYPTGMVMSLHREIERSINIDVESSSRDDDVTVITNLSSVEASYTVVQGTHALSLKCLHSCNTRMLHKNEHTPSSRICGGTNELTGVLLLAANCIFHSDICILLEIIFHILLFFLIPSHKE